MAMLKSNASGNIQSLPSVTLNGGRVRAQIETVPLAAQASGAKIGVARLPVGAALLGIEALADVTLGAATLKFGDYNDDAKFGAAAAPAAALTKFAAAATYGVPIVTGYDSDNGRTDKGYEDIIMTTGAAALPGAGNLRVVTYYTID